MQGEADVTVLRLGHRPGRDERMTTHVGLTARALGADRVVLAGSARDRRDAIEEITDRFGGPFTVGETTSTQQFVTDWEGSVCHLTMYGLPVQSVMPEIRERHAAGTRLLVVVGASKVPFDVYDDAEWNVAVTNQPHSEVAALAVTLDRLFQGRELDREWIGADRRVVPESTGKSVVDVDGE